MPERLTRVSKAADEEEHRTCFFPKAATSYWMQFHPDCPGDGWYRCRECVYYIGKDNPCPRD